MKGWKYEWASELPQDVYDVLLEEIANTPKTEFPED
jgi:hypothetical protein